MWRQKWDEGQLCKSQIKCNLRKWENTYIWMIIWMKLYIKLRWFHPWVAHDVFKGSNILQAHTQQIWQLTQDSTSVTQFVSSHSMKYCVLCLLRPERTSSACWRQTEPGLRLWRLNTAPQSPPNPCRPCRETGSWASAAAALTTCTRSPWPRSEV